MSTQDRVGWMARTIRMRSRQLHERAFGRGEAPFRGWDRGTLPESTLRGPMERTTTATLWR